MRILFIMVLALLSYNEREVIYLEEATQELLLPFNDLPILVDSAGTMSFEQVQNVQKGFVLHTQFKPKDYCTSCVYWVKLPIYFDRSSDKEWVLEFYDQTIDQIDAYFPQQDGTYQMETVGDMYPFSNKGFQHKNFEWLLDTDLEGQQVLYFKVQSHAYADIRIAIRTINEFVGYAINEYFLYGIFYGTILIILLYNMLIYLAIREVKYLYYTFYLISVGVYAMCVDGIAFQYLWPNASNWNQIAYGTAMFSLIFWAMVFGQRFLGTRVRTPRLHRLITGMIIARTVLFLVGLFFYPEVFEWRSIEILPLSLIFIAGILTLSRGYKPARFFVMAYGVLFLGFLAKALINLSIIPHVVLSYYSLHIAFLLEMLFLTFALSDRVRILKSNRDRALKRIIIQHQQNVKLKDKVNKELESLVNKRTEELQRKYIQLEEANQKLNTQTNDIARINSMLDLDNWKLKNNIKEILQDRLINKKLTLEEFQRIFPDKISCYRFLDRLKWKEGYECIKCGNEKYSQGHLKFSRRCSTCGYDESVTSNTIFHRLRFPIEKAFYILYVTNNRQIDYTLDELSEILELRRNTVWSFKKKIEELFSNRQQSQLLIEDLFSAHFVD